MAQEAFESIDTRTMSSSNGRLTATRTFHIYDNVDPILTPAQLDFGSNAVPQIGDLFPDENSLFCSDYSITHVADSQYTWQVVFTYSSGQGAGGGGSTPITPSEVGWVQFTAQFSAIFKELYRDGGVNLQGGNPVATTDIGGTSVDAAGIPLSVFVPRHTLTITETESSIEIGSGSLLATFVGTRNSAEFFGYTAGMLLYEGANMSRTGLYTYSISHQFAYDPHYHMIQQAKRDVNGHLVIEAATIPFASVVRFIQPFKTTKNFKSISRNF